jgi:hypothetical protein
MAEDTIINIDAGIEGDDDINADWIKRVNGGRSQIQELAIHKRLAKKYAAGAKGKGGGKNSALLAALTGEAAAPDTEEDADAEDATEDAPDTEEDAAAAEDAPEEDAAPATPKGKGDAPFTKPGAKDTAAPKDAAKPAAFGGKPKPAFGANGAGANKPAAADDDEEETDV